MRITIVAAMDENRLMAGPQGIPWPKLPRDSQHLRDSTNGHHMLLGRTTYEEMMGWFDRQIPVVLTTRQTYPVSEPGGFAVPDIETSIQRVRETGETNFIIGGGSQVYHLAMPHVTHLYLTTVHGQFEGTKYFPEWSQQEWRIKTVSRYDADAENAYGMTFTLLERV